jgi:hypothetical protein
VGGRYVFLEPMITRAHILAKRAAADPAARDEVIPIPSRRRCGCRRLPGRVPHHVGRAAREYRIALTQLARRG